MLKKIMGAGSLALVLLVSLTIAAVAQTVTAPAAASSSSDILALILTGITAAIPTLFVALWSWFKAHAAQSAATWDDEAVALVQKIAQAVVDNNASGSTATAAQAVPLTGVDK